MSRIGSAFRSHLPFSGAKGYIVAGLILATFPVGWHPPGAATSSGLTMPINMSLQDSLLFVSDRSTGIHLYNIQNPTAPEFVLHIPLQGNRGTAARDDIVYANDYTSLLVIRVQGDSFEVVKTIKREVPFVDNVIFDRGGNRFGCDCARDEFMRPAFAPSVGSSFATFAVIDSFLYYLDHSSIVTMDISTPEDPVELSRTHIGWSIETLFPTQKYLFVGGTRGMHIFDRGDPKRPVEIAEVEHFRACDPVVVSDSLAFVTLRGGTRCGQTRDVLLSISIKDPVNPKVIGEKPLSTPYGLAIDNSLLYVSTGESGYELLDVTGPSKPARVKAWPGWPTKDFIWWGDILYVMGFTNVRIYDVTTPEAPVLLSQLEPVANVARR